MSQPPPVDDKPEDADSVDAPGDAPNSVKDALADAPDSVEDALADAPDSMEEVLAEALAEEGAPSVDEVDIRDALRAALAPPAGEISITEKVQQKIRQDPEFEGQFFADGWSTSRAPRETYLITSAVMLLVVIAIYLLLRPYGL